MEKKLLTYIQGFLLIIFGVLFIINPQGVFGSIVLIAGILILLVSAFKAIAILRSKDPYMSFGFMGSLIGVIFGLVLITNRDDAIKVIPVMLGLWFLVTGITSLMFVMKSSRDKTLIGKSVLKIVLGLISFLLPVIPVVGAGIVIGVFLIISGVMTFVNMKDEEVIYKVKVKK